MDLPHRSVKKQINATSHKLVRWDVGSCTGKKVRSVTSMPGEADTNHQSHPPLTIISLPMGCTAFGKSITLPLFYQSEEKFESSDSILALSNISSDQWEDLWKPLVTSPLNVTLRRLPKSSYINQFSQ